MDPLDWIPELYPRSGGLSAAGFSKLLGRPRLDPLTVLVRETAQNSWDARLDDLQSVVFNLETWTLDPGERSTLRDLVFPESVKAKGTGLKTALHAEELSAMYVWDSNTIGLGGPLQAGVEDSNGTYDWADFVLNVGKANTADQTGGTYGFGKTISYVTSTVRTIVIYSRTNFGGRTQSRLIGCSIGDEFGHRGRLYTGRHWWGRADKGDPLPVTGRSADSIAKRLGMPEYGEGQLGTVIMILAPDFGGRTAHQAMNFVAESVVWHLWPKMMERDGVVPMEFHVVLDGDEVEIPSPAQRPPLQGFEQAFRLLLGGQEPPGARRDVIKSQRPKTEIGDLVTVPLVEKPRAVVDDGYAPMDPDGPRAAAAITGVSHHVALLRSPELVVEYMEGPVAPEAKMEWAGVFKCRPEHDHHFAAAEPPTHDTWRPELLPDRRDRRIVNIGLREIRRALDDRWGTPKTPQDQTATSTATIAAELAGLVRSVDGRGLGTGSSGGGGDAGPGRVGPKVEVLSAGPEIEDGAAVTKARFRVTPRLGSKGTLLRIVCGTALDGSTMDATLDPSVRLLRLTSPREEISLKGSADTVELSESGVTDVVITVARGDETTVLLDVQPEAV